MKHLTLLLTTASSRLHAFSGTKARSRLNLYPPFLPRIRFQFGRPQQDDNDSRKNTNEIASRT